MWNKHNFVAIKALIQEMNLKLKIRLYTHDGLNFIKYDFSLMLSERLNISGSNFGVDMK